MAEVARSAELRSTVAQWVEESCRVQGIPTKVTDVAVLGQIAVLLGKGRVPEELQTRHVTSKRLGSKRVRPLIAGFTVT